MKIIQLMLIDDAEQDRFLCAGIGSDRFDLGTTVMQFMGELFNKLLLMGGDDGEFISGLGGLQKQIADKGGDKAI